MLSGGLVVFNLKILLSFCVPVPGHYEAVRLLLFKGVPVDPLNHRGTPLIVAAAMGQDQVVKILLDHGADVSFSIDVMLLLAPAVLPIHTGRGKHRRTPHLLKFCFCCT